MLNDILLDTECSRTLVRSDLVDKKKLLEREAITIQCAHGDTVLYPLAQVELQVEGKLLMVEATVSDTLPRSVLLGTDVPQLTELFGQQKTCKQRENALVVVTRSQARKQQKEEAAVQKETELSGV